MGTAVETKRRKRKLIIYDTLAFLFLAIAAIVFAINHTFAIFAIPLLLIGLTIAAFALRLTLINFGSTHAFATRWGLAIGIPSFLLCGFLFWFELHPGQQEPKPHSDFLFSMCLSDAHDDAIELTNDFLIVTNFEKYVTLGTLCLPMKTGETNATLGFLVRNNSAVLAEKVEVTVFLTKNLLGVPAAGWLESESKTSITHADISGKMQTDKEQTWMFPLPMDLLSGNGHWLPDLQVSETDIHAEWGQLAIMTRSKDSPAKILAFNLCFVPNQLKNVKPLVLLAKEIPNVGEVIVIPPEK